MASIKIFAQAPFTPLVKEPRFLEKKVHIDNKEKFVALTDTTPIKAKVDNDMSMLENRNEIKESKKKDINFIGSGSIVLTYQADGQAGTYNTDGEYESERYSILVTL